MSLSKNELDEVESSISDRIYIKIEKWNLFLGDAGLSKALAIECNAYLSQGADVAARRALEGVQVQLGNGNTKLPLARMIPSGQIFDLEEILAPYCR